jgi:hypothetical protein
MSGVSFSTLGWGSGVRALRQRLIRAAGRLRRPQAVASTRRLASPLQATLVGGDLLRVLGAPLESVSTAQDDEQHSTSKRQFSHANFPRESARSSSSRSEIAPDGRRALKSTLSDGSNFVRTSSEQSETPLQASPGRRSAQAGMTVARPTPAKGSLARAIEQYRLTVSKGESDANSSGTQPVRPPFEARPPSALPHQPWPVLPADEVSLRLRQFEGHGPIGVPTRQFAGGVTSDGLRAVPLPPLLTLPEVTTGEESESLLDRVAIALREQAIAHGIDVV